MNLTQLFFFSVLLIVLDFANGCTPTATTMCCNGVSHHRTTPNGTPQDCCGSRSFITTTQMCCGNTKVHGNEQGGVTRICCGIESYLVTSQMCCENTVNSQDPGRHCCGTGTFNPFFESCCDGQVVYEAGVCPSPTPPPSPSPSPISHGDPSPSPPAGGRMDPIFTGFDGAKFSFSGVAKHSYLLFRRVGGDVLTTRMKHGGFHGKNRNLPTTYFNAFGLKTGAGAIIKVLVTKKSCEDTDLLACVHVFVHGKLMSRRETKTVVGTKIWFSSDRDVHVTTPDTDLVFYGRALKTKRFHIDFDIRLNKEPTEDHQFDGLLGITLQHNLKNRALRVRGKRSKMQLEKIRRAAFETDTLFPNFN